MPRKTGRLANLKSVLRVARSSRPASKGKPGEVECDEARKEIADFCRSIGVRYIQLPAERPLDAILLGDFRRYGVLE